MSHRLNIAIIEDDELIRESFRNVLSDSHPFTFFTHALDFLNKAPPNALFHMIFLDLLHPGDSTGEEALSAIGEIRSRFPDAELTIQSALKDLSMMRECILRGAHKFLLKDSLFHQLPGLLALKMEVVKNRRQLDQMIFGKSESISRLKNKLLEIKYSSSQDILICGETGSGKELCARAIHLENTPWVSVNASAIPPELFEAEFFGSDKGAYTGAHQSRAGHFESAAGGILFIDEIQSLTLPHQAKLLRVLETRSFTRVGSSQERPLRCRILFAANTPLKEAADRGLFREDLFYRIASLQLQVPPLRVRKEDLAPLAKYFSEEFPQNTHHKTMTPEGVRTLQNHPYDWPGNVRELKNFILNLCRDTPIPFLDAPELIHALENIEITTDSTKTKPLSAPIKHSEQTHSNLSFDERVSDFEKALLRETLHSCGSTKAREILKMSRTRFYDKLKQYQISSD